MELSNQAKILIRKERYEALSPEEKEKLSKLDLTVEIFEGELKDAVDKALEESGRYTSETLSLESEHRGYIESETSNELKETINGIAKEKDILQELHYFIFTEAERIDSEKLKNVKDDYKKVGKVQEFYKKTFFHYLFSKMDIPNEVKVNADICPEASIYMEDLCDEIGRIGIDEYKKILDQYNGALEKLRESGKLFTPQQIIELKKERKEDELLKLIEETIEKENENDGKKTFLESGIEATEEATKMSTINEQAENIKNIHKEKTEDKELEEETQDDR